VIDMVGRVAAVVGAELRVETAAPARAHWEQAPLVLVGADAVQDPVPRPRRDGVVLVALAPAGSPVPERLWRDAVEIGAERVAVLPEAESWLASRMTEAVESVGTPGQAIGVIGGRGGAGASVLAAALAVTAGTWGTSTVLVDADPWGGGIDLVLGAEDVPGLRWPDLASVRGWLPPGPLTAALPQVDGVAVLSWDRGGSDRVPAEAVHAVVSSAVRVAELVVVDLPRTLDETASPAVRLCDLVLVVVPAEVRATAAAGRVVSAVRSLVPEVGVVVRGPAPARLSASAIAETLDARLVGELRAEPGLGAALDRGEPPALRGRGPLGSLCRRILAETLPFGPGRHRPGGALLTDPARGRDDGTGAGR
jgi:secretion/DNA translocation related CpaE-like protein